MDSKDILLVSNKDLPAVDYLSQRHRFVRLPFRDSLSALDDNDEIIVLALVVALALLSVSTHDC